jgi:hypothetical protein
MERDHLVRKLEDNLIYLLDLFENILGAPYYAYIVFLNANNQGNFGGGSLISARHVLTAAVNIQG